MPRGHGGKIPKEARAFIFGLLKGVAGKRYGRKQISKLVYERFGVKVSPKTITNWQSIMPSEMVKHGITDDYIQEVIDRALLGDLRQRDEPGVLRREVDRELESPDRGISEEKGYEPDEGEKQEILKFNNLAELITFCEGKGFIVGKNFNDIIKILEANNMRVVDNAKSLLGVENIFISPVELDIELVGRSIVANPVIQFYYALARRKQPDLDITAWLTACVVDVYNNADPPIRLAVLYG